MQSLVLERARTAQRRLRQARENVTLAARGLESAELLHELLALDAQQRLHDLLDSDRQQRTTASDVHASGVFSSDFYFLAPAEDKRGQDGLCVSVDPETLALNVQTVPRESVQGSVDTFILDFNGLQRSVGVCYANAGKVLFSSSML